MQIKKFEAPTIQEALDAIKRELGPEAIILQTKRNKRGFGLVGGASIEVTAAISDRSIQKKKFAEHRLPDDKREELASLPASRQADILDKALDRHLVRSSRGTEASAPSVTQRRYIDIDPADVPRPRSPRPNIEATTSRANIEAVASASQLKGHGTLEDEVKHLKRMIEELKIAQEESGNASPQLASQLMGTPSLLDAFESLLLSGVDKRYALALVKKAAFELGPTESANPESVLDQVTFELMSATEVAYPFENLTPGSRGEAGPYCLALVGPTGVGKTTTIAKIASQVILGKNLRVGLINFDSFKVAAVDQLATYAKILNVPFRSVATADELQAALADFKTLDLVLIDTTGRSQRDLTSLKEMSEILKQMPITIQSHLVVSATTRDTELYDTAARFAIFKPQAAIVSKLDEATLFGSIYNVSQKAKLPLSFFTTGQRVPEDIEEATRERVAALIMDL